MNDSQEMEKIPRKNSWKRFLSTIGAGVVGSVLTLSIVLNTPLVQGNENTNEVNTSTPSVQEEDSSYTVQQTSAAPNSLADMVEQTSKAIVGIVNIQNQRNPFSPFEESVESGSGSGVIFKKEGDSAYIVTNNHVIEGAKEIDISLENGEKTKAELVGADALTDLAVLKIDKKYAEETLEFGNSDELRAGDQVIAIGNPLGLEFSRTVTQGIISAVNRSVQVQTSAGLWDLNVIQTDAAINPGNSGGALINSKGQLIGINSLKIKENGVEGLGFAIPSNEALPLIEKIIEHGKIERPYLGVTLVDLKQVPDRYLQELPVEVEDGVMITGIESGSAAAKAGIQVQDVIVAINGTEIKNSTELRKTLYTDLNIGDKVKFELYRKGERKIIETVLTAEK